VEVYLHSFLTSTVDGGEWSTAGPDSYTREESPPNSHLIGGGVHLTGGDASELCPCQELCHDFSVVQPVA
jgi:hypothetical protein